MTGEKSPGVSFGMKEIIGVALIVVGLYLIFGSSFSVKTESETGDVVITPPVEEGEGND